MVAGTDNDAPTIVAGDDELMGHFVSYTEEALNSLAVLSKNIDGAGDPLALSGELHALAHNIKGMGSSFGFPLMTRIATILCAHLRGDKGFGPPAATLVQACISAMSEVMTECITGDGGERGVAIMQRLEKLAANTTA